ncbi:MAG: hypothetical protein V3V92_01970 [Candidatus Hydrothermarchaeales archaeon]
MKMVLKILPFKAKSGIIEAGKVEFVVVPDNFALEWQIDINMGKIHPLAGNSLTQYPHRKIGGYDKKSLELPPVDVQTII